MLVAKSGANLPEQAQQAYEIRYDTKTHFFYFDKHQAKSR